MNIQFLSFYERRTKKIFILKTLIIKVNLYNLHKKDVFFLLIYIIFLVKQEEKRNDYNFIFTQNDYIVCHDKFGSNTTRSFQNKVSLRDLKVGKNQDTANANYFYKIVKENKIKFLKSLRSIKKILT